MSRDAGPIDRMSFVRQVERYTAGMADIPDLQLHDTSIRSLNDGEASEIARDDAGERQKWIALIAMLVLATVVLGYVAIRRWNTTTRQPIAAPVAEARPRPAAPARRGPLVEAEKIALPPLAETDAIVRQLLVKLSSHPRALAWLATKGLIENFAVATLNLSDGKTPVAHWPTLKPQTRFAVINTPRGLALDPKSYARYDDYAAAIGGLDPAGTARLYLTLKPRIMDAYRGLGFPEGDFDPVLERAFGVLLSAPIVDIEIPVREKVITYEFVDPLLESQPGGAKQLLRMGPANMKIVQDKLREIARQLGLTLQ